MHESYGRAVLVAELIERVGAQQLGASLDVRPGVLTLVALSIRRTAGVSIEAAKVSRYAPLSITEAHRCTDVSFHQRVSRSRPDGWSWTELAATGAPMSAACLSAIAQDVFEEAALLPCHQCTQAVAANAAV